MQFKEIRRMARVTAATAREAVLGAIIITALHGMDQGGRRRIIEFLEPSITAARAIGLAEALFTEHSLDEAVPEGHFDFPCPHGEDHVHWLPTTVDIRAAALIDETCGGAWTMAVEAVGREHRDVILSRAVRATGGVIIGAESFTTDATVGSVDDIVNAMRARFAEMHEEGGGENG